MFPDLVRFRWQAEDQRGRKVELSGDEQLEQRDDDQEVRITSMLIIDQHKAKNSKFTCSVQHESSFDDKKLNIPRVKHKTRKKNCPMPKVHEEEEENFMTFGVFELRCSLYLFSVTYVILLVKNVLYFCTVSVFLSKRNAPNNTTSHATTNPLTVKSF
ncbi:hypothetical protein PHYPO_G00196710 [Pangasianodon hypophthalmus]|uniref:Ig-like domain-containing protein n=1 Tax=Pangasianodon hypophthalmus TaxID=310915 RepID=A0A5N5PKU3_PANHP|nr:hypothetical protein PHYPO_G00196710 [Pangasianodon hypophthalmus]